MSTPDDTGRIPPPRVSTSSRASSLSSSTRKIFPGRVTSDQDDAGPSAAAQSPVPASALPYLRNGASPAKKGPPTRLELGPRSSSSPNFGTGGSVIGGLRTGGLDRPLGSSGTRRRPSPLELGRAKAIGLDEELQEQRDLDAPHTAYSVISVDCKSFRWAHFEDLLTKSYRLAARRYAGSVSTPEVCSTESVAATYRLPITPFRVG